MISLYFITKKCVSLNIGLLDSVAGELKDNIVTLSRSIDIATLSFNAILLPESEIIGDQFCNILIKLISDYPKAITFCVMYAV